MLVSVLLLVTEMMMVMMVLGLVTARRCMSCTSRLLPTKVRLAGFCTWPCSSLASAAGLGLLILARMPIHACTTKGHAPKGSAHHAPSASLPQTQRSQSSGPGPMLDLYPVKALHMMSFRMML